MSPLLGSAIPHRAMLSFGGDNLEAALVYSLVAFVIGLIAWSRYNEPPLSKPYPEKTISHDLSDMAAHPELGPLVAIPVVVNPVSHRKRL